ncbi:hypothetical protein [Halorubrum sp. BV1]|uniref:hypothetical protein n=1 Tax=Halorubrum sp. BV1 TaxID=1498500 RepID=UPI000678ED6C|nr:hypothetical protein [Halorubrum sp. BV1]
MASYDPEEGILYTALGQEFFEEAVESANRLREVGIDYPIAIITNQEQEEDCFDEVLPVDKTVKNRQDWLSVRLENLDRTPFERTVYLDTDTWVVDKDALSDLFELLERFDVIAPDETGRRLDIYRPESESTLPEVRAPDAFPMLHAGIFGFKRSDTTDELLEKWEEIFDRHLSEWDELDNDQPAFREAIYQTNVNVGLISPEYRFRIPFPQYVVGEVKIIHGRAPNIPEIASKINSDTGRRIYHPIHTNEGLPEGGPVAVSLDSGQVERSFAVFRQSMREAGVLSTLGFTALGGPVTGRRRAIAIGRSLREKGLVSTLRSGGRVARTQVRAAMKSLREDGVVTTSKKAIGTLLGWG